MERLSRSSRPCPKWGTLVAQTLERSSRALRASLAVLTHRSYFCALHCRLIVLMSSHRGALLGGGAAGLGDAIKGGGGSKFTGLDVKVRPRRLSIVLQTADRVSLVGSACTLATGAPHAAQTQMTCRPRTDHPSLPQLGCATTPRPWTLLA